MKRVRCIFSLTVALIVSGTHSAMACGVCMGQTEGSQIGGAVNGAIFVMLGFIGAMLAGISAVAFSIWRRSKNPLPPYTEFGDLVSAHPSSK